MPKSDCPTTIIPSPQLKTVGKPKKKTRRTIEEIISQKEKYSQMASVIATQSKSQGSNKVDKLSRKFGSVTYAKCKLKGLNLRACK